MHKLQGKTKALEMYLLLYKFQKIEVPERNFIEYILREPKIKVVIWYGGGSAEVKLYMGSNDEHQVTSYFNFDNIIDEINEEIDRDRH